MSGTLLAWLGVGTGVIAMIAAVLLHVHSFRRSAASIHSICTHEPRSMSLHIDGEEFVIELTESAISSDNTRRELKRARARLDATQQERARSFG